MPPARPREHQWLPEAVVMAMRAVSTTSRQQNGFMATATAVPIEQRLAVMVAGISRLITAQEAWLV